MKAWFTGAIIWMVALLQGQSNLAFVPAGNHNKGGEKLEATEAYEPFFVVNGMVFVQARIEDRYTNFILDTGAPGIVLNSKEAGRGAVAGSGISGGTEVRQITVSRFEFGGREQSAISAYALDMDRLEASTGRRVEGLLGHSFFEGAELQFDYLRNLLHIIYQPETEEKTLLEIPFQLESHLPVIFVKVNGKTLRLGLDTGSEVNILDSRMAERLDLSTESAEPMTLMGLDKKEKNALLTILPSLRVKGQTFENLPLVLTDISDLTAASGLQFDGLLGYPFFKNMRFSIDYRRQKLMVWEMR